MSRLPSERYLIQQIGNQVILFQDGTERELCRFDPASSNSVLAVQEVIRSSELNDQDKCFASFWSGYFHFHNKESSSLVPEEMILGEGQEAVIRDNDGNEVTRFSPADGGEVSRKQKDIFDSAMTPEEKSMAHLRSGFLYAHAVS
jgi:hypothetical protein